MRYMLARLRQGEEGFTLIELLVVVAIIALLATFAAPKLFDAINRSKKAPGQADLQTISSALERYYMDSNAFPLSAAATETALKGAYLKTGTTFLNGFKQGYLYGTTAAGGGYVLIDLQGTTAPVNITCNGNTYLITGSTTGLGMIANILAADINLCVAPTGSSMVTH